MGDVGKHYNLVSEQTHQLTMRLKLGQMFDHNGTYMDVSAHWPCKPLILVHTHIYIYIGSLIYIIYQQQLCPTQLPCYAILRYASRLAVITKHMCSYAGPWVYVPAAQDCG